MPPPTPPSVNDGRMTSGKPSVSRELDRLGERARDAALRHVEADLAHRVLEQQPILGDLDRLDRRADQLDVVLLERCRRSARSTARLSAVWPPTVGSSASGRSRSMIASSDFRRQRLDVGAIGQLRVGHDRRRVAVDEDRPRALRRAAPCTPGVPE